MSPNAGSPALRYDNVTIRLHWAMMLLVVLQWVGAELIDFIPGKPAHQLYWSIHVTLGVLLALIVTAQIVWRFTGGTRLPPANAGGLGLLTRLVHGLLNLLPAIIVVLGIGIVLTRSRTLYGVLTIPTIPGVSKPQARQVHELHELLAHVLMALAALHAMAALYHHYGLRDGVLARMAPWLAGRKAAA